VPIFGDRQSVHTYQASVVIAYRVFLAAGLGSTLVMRRFGSNSKATLYASEIKDFLSQLVWPFSLLASAQVLLKSNSLDLISFQFRSI
jgi:hypothetical protein